MFEWDDEKNAINKQKHNLSFEVASLVFDDPYHIEFVDYKHSLQEQRFVAIGKVGDIIFVVFTERGEKIRLISARLATKKERRMYYNDGHL